MGDKTTIEWADATWNPITGCSLASWGCNHCYAMRLAGGRLRNHPSRAGLTQETRNGPVWTGEVRFNEEWLDQPKRWTRPRRIFVCAHGDLFHPAVPRDWIARVFGVMASAHCERHVFQVLTKRPGRAWTYLTGPLGFALPNVWLGVSAEDQRWAEARIPVLLATPAAVRWLSAEPLLGEMNLRRLHLGDDLYLDALTGAHMGRIRHLPLPRRMPGLDWVVAGGESGPRARPMDVAWVRDLRDQCLIMTTFSFKQWGGVTSKSGGRELDGRTWDEMPGVGDVNA